MDTGQYKYFTAKGWRKESAEGCCGFIKANPFKRVREAVEGKKRCASYFIIIKKCWWREYCCESAGWVARWTVGSRVRGSSGPACPLVPGGGELRGGSVTRRWLIVLQPQRHSLPPHCLRRLHHISTLWLWPANLHYTLNAISGNSQPCLSLVYIALFAIDFGVVLGFEIARQQEVNIINRPSDNIYKILHYITYY